MGSVPLVDQWLYSRLTITIETVNEALKNYRFHEAAQNVYQFFWGDFCDWYIEWVKPELQNANRERAVVAWKNLFAAFNDALRPSASVHAVFDGGVVAPIAASGGCEVDCAGSVP